MEDSDTIKAAIELLNLASKRHMERGPHTIETIKEETKRQAVVHWLGVMLKKQKKK